MKNFAKATPDPTKAAEERTVERRRRAGIMAIVHPQCHLVERACLVYSLVKNNL